MALQAAMKRGARQVRQARMQGIETVIKRQQSVLEKGNDCCFSFKRQNGRSRTLGWQVSNRRPFLPLRHRLLLMP